MPPQSSGRRLPQICCLALLLIASCAQKIEVADGDTLIIGTAHYRLWSVQAPTLHQTCAEGWQAGEEARRTLTALVNGHRVTCEERGLDPYRRVLAVCRADGVDIGGTMISRGLAWSTGNAYVGVERDAQAAGRGMHAFECRMD